MRKITEMIQGKEVVRYEFFSVPNNTRRRFNRYAPDRKTTLLPLPDKFELDPEWIRITDKDEFLEIFDTASHDTANHIDEFAVYVHKLDPHFKWGRFTNHKEALMEEIGKEKARNMMYEYKLNPDEMTYFELEEFFATVFDIEISLDREMEEVTISKKKATEYKHGEDWTKYDKEELKTFCREKGLTVSGTKKQLITKLEANSLFLKKEAETTVKNKNIEDLDKGELQKLLMSRNLNAHGDVDDLRERVKASGLF